MVINKNQIFNPLSNQFDEVLDAEQIEALIAEKSDSVKDNLTAIVDPTITDDDSLWYKKKSTWMNTVTSEIFMCLDNTIWAAKWIKTSLTIDELGSLALFNLVKAANLSSFPVTWDINTLYYALDTAYIYTYTGLTYKPVSDNKTYVQTYSNYASLPSIGTEWIIYETIDTWFIYIYKIWTWYKVPVDLSDINNKLDLKQTVFTWICQEQYLTENDIVIDCVSATPTLTIATVKNWQVINGVNPICFYTDWNGISKKHTKDTAVSVSFTYTTWLWYFYFNSNGDLIATQTPWTDFSDIASVYRLYLNASLAWQTRVVAESVEYHKNDISWADHAWKHSQWTVWQKWFEIVSNRLASGAPNADWRNTVVSLTEWTNIDDNLFYTVKNSTGGTLKFSQDLGQTNPALLDSTDSWIFNRNTSIGGVLVPFAWTRYPFSWDTATNRPEYITSAWVRTLVPSWNFFVYYLYALQDPRRGEAIKTISAEVPFTTALLATGHTWESLQSLYPTIKDNEIRPLYKLTFEVRSSGGWSYDAGCKYSVLRTIEDIRKQRVTTSAVASGSLPASSVTETTDWNVQTAIDNLRTSVITPSFQSTTDSSIWPELITLVEDRVFSSATNNWTGTNWSTSGWVFQHTVRWTSAATLNAYKSVIWKKYEISITVNTTTIWDIYMSYWWDSTVYLTSRTWSISFRAQFKSMSETFFSFVTDVKWLWTIDNVSIKEIIQITPTLTIKDKTWTGAANIVASTPSSFWIWSWALLSNRAQNNIAIWINSGNSISSWSGNVSVGPYSSQENTIWINNSAFWMSALQWNLIGGNNSVFWANAGMTNTYWANNTIMWTGAAQYCKDGSWNVVIGTNSVSNCLYSSDTTTLWNSAWRFNKAVSSVTSAIDSIAIGSASRFLTATPTNEIVIGRGANWNWDNTTTLWNDSVTATYLKGTVETSWYTPTTNGQLTPKWYVDSKFAGALVPGSFWLWGTWVVAASADSIRFTWFYTTSATTTGLPYATWNSNRNGNIIHVEGSSGLESYQMFNSTYDLPNTGTWIRYRTVIQSWWTPWTKVYTAWNILWTVSQTAWVPTGWIIQSGSNVWGRFVKYADGTMIQTMKWAENRSGTGKVTTTVVYPMPFITRIQDDIGSSINVTIASSVPENITSYGVSLNDTVSQCEVIITRSTSTPTTFYITATGRWF